MPRQLQQLAYDLRIGLAIEAVPVDRTGGAHFIEHRAVNCASTRPSGPQQRAVDIEEDQAHD